jgi:hypothetical protein
MHVEQAYASAPTFDQTRPLKCRRHDGYARPPNAKHFGNKLVGECDLVAISDIAAP